MIVLVVKPTLMVEWQTWPWLSGEVVSAELIGGFGGLKGVHQPKRSYDSLILFYDFSFRAWS